MGLLSWLFGKKSGNKEAELLKIINANEAQSRSDRMGVPPAYYERLAILYRKEKRYAKEVEILERYFAQKQAPGKKSAKLATRLKKAKQLASSKP